MDKTIYAICEALHFDKINIRTHIYFIKQRYNIRDEDFEDIISTTYEKFLKIEVKKNGESLFLKILKRDLIRFCNGLNFRSGAKRRDSLYSLFNDNENDFVFEDTIEKSFFDKNIIPEDFVEIIENDYQKNIGKSGKTFEEKMMLLEDFYKL